MLSILKGCLRKKNWKNCLINYDKKIFFYTLEFYTKQQEQTLKKLQKCKKKNCLHLD